MYAKYYRILNKYVDRIKVHIKVNSLHRISRVEDANYGDMLDAAVIVNAEFRPMYSDTAKNTTTDFTRVTSPEIKGKITSGFIHTITFEPAAGQVQSILSDPDFLGWELKIWRETVESWTVDLSNQTMIESIVEEFDQMLCHPYSAFVSSKFSA